jgi:photosystem II stability/assembly factor-like uncharacterized protein
MNSKLNTIILTALMIFTVTTGAAAQDNWYAQSSGTVDQLMDVHFADAENGWAVGVGATILHTDNGGNSWAPQTFDPVSWLTDVYFLDALNGWTVGYGGHIRHTADGGNSWEMQTSGTSYTIYGVYFADASTGWIVGGRPADFSPGSRFIRYTTDGGATWNSQFGTYDAPILKSISFGSALNGVAVGGDSILFTADGGANWAEAVHSPVYEMESVQMVDAYTGYAVGRSGEILRTDDSGANWADLVSGTGAWLTGVSFVTVNEGWVSGGSGLTSLILHTTDGGSSWEVQSNGDFASLANIHFSDADNGWAVGYNGEIVHTSPIPPDTVSADFGCLPGSGVLPFTVSIQATLGNMTGFNRVVAGRVQVTLGNGVMYKNYRSGYTTLSGFENFTAGWNQNMPALFALEGDNVFTFSVRDVTPAPFNQPPYPASDDTDFDSCTVIGLVP